MFIKMDEHLLNDWSLTCITFLLFSRSVATIFLKSKYINKKDKANLYERTRRTMWRHLLVYKFEWEKKKKENVKYTNRPPLWKEPEISCNNCYFYGHFQGTDTTVAGQIYFTKHDWALLIPSQLYWDLLLTVTQHGQEQAAPCWVAWLSIINWPNLTLTSRALTDSVYWNTITHTQPPPIHRTHWLTEHNSPTQSQLTSFCHH